MATIAINSNPESLFGNKDAYFTIEFLNNYTYPIKTNKYHDFYYSINNADWNVIEKSETDTTINISINKGDKLHMKMEVSKDSELDSIGNNILTPIEDIDYNVLGFISSLWRGDKCIDKNTFDLNHFNIKDLFMQTNVVNAENLVLTNNTIEACFMQMFQDCKKLINAPKLPATTMSFYCYSSMFGGCTNLVKAPELPATKLYDFCYNEMFYGCSSLTTAPELPATKLKMGCYTNMFGGCTNLVKAPELPATKYVDNAYDMMFQDCTNLNYIKAMIIDIMDNIFLINGWLVGVSATGTFVKNKAAKWELDYSGGETGENSIPKTWTIETA